MNSTRFVRAALYFLCGVAPMLMSRIGKAYGANERVVYSFKSFADGAYPSSTLISDSSGNLYGTTAVGGDDKRCGGEGCGTVFKLAPDGTKTILHAFVGRSRDGARPLTGLISDGAGNFYGTTHGGGPKCYRGKDGCGTVFKVASNGKEAILHAFAGGYDGMSPGYSPLIMDETGNLYGTTFLAGEGHTAKLGAALSSN
jgi:uncharacterized repeat protein (TIGR03803 family)